MKDKSMDARAEEFAATANLGEGTHKGDVVTAYVIGASDQEVIMNKQSYFKRLEELEYPHREICHLCHRAVPVGFWVPNEIWTAVVHHSHLNAIHCLNCFIERADEKLINWSKDIQFYAVSLRSHLDSIHDGNDEMLPFHVPPR